MDLHGKGSYFVQDELKVLIKKMDDWELMELQKIIVSRPQSFRLEKLLYDAFENLRPKPSEYELRKQVIKDLNDIAKELYANSDSCPVVEEFGSFLMDLFTEQSDLDLSINFTNSSSVFRKAKKIKTLKKFEEKLLSLQVEGYVQMVKLIDRTDVPIIKFVDTATSVQCDISVENRIGISKSLFIRHITSIDERFQKLSVLVKAWAKAHNINSSRNRTLNSFTIVLLVAFHLQTRDPPILPPFSDILKDGKNPTSVEGNAETLAGLFVSFLIKMASVEELWPQGLCASPYLGHWISKTWNNNITNMNVEDFLDRTQNVTRRVGPQEVKKIYDSVHYTIGNLDLFMKFKVDEYELMKSLFGVDYINLNGVRDPRAGQNWSAWPPPTHDWGAPQHQAVTRMWTAEEMAATQWWGQASGGYWQPQGMGGGASTSSWGEANGAAFMDDHLSWPQEMQPPTAPWGRRLQQHPYDNLHLEKLKADRSYRRYKMAVMRYHAEMAQQKKRDSDDGKSSEDDTTKQM